MGKFEKDYVELVKNVLANGEDRSTRNSDTLSLFNQSIGFDMAEEFPILQIRKMYPKGVFGELAAMLKGPTCAADFAVEGCNYWSDFADKDGNLVLDYGNKWIDFNGVNQLEDLVNKLVHTPSDRRLIITSWDPSNIDNLTLPCCHHTYQFYVRTYKGNRYLDMHWMQRSTDVMVGLPSDAIFAAALAIYISARAFLTPGKVVMTLGDTHIYNAHIAEANRYIHIASASINSRTLAKNMTCTYNVFDVAKGFNKDRIEIPNYKPLEVFKYEVML